jgi:hypothetical protein
MEIFVSSQGAHPFCNHFECVGIAAKKTTDKGLREVRFLHTLRPLYIASAFQPTRGRMMNLVYANVGPFRAKPGPPLPRQSRILKGPLCSDERMSRGVISKSETAVGREQDRRAASFRGDKAKRRRHLARNVHVNSHLGGVELAQFSAPRFFSPPTFGRRSSRLRR